MHKAIGIAETKLYGGGALLRARCYAAPLVVKNGRTHVLRARIVNKRVLRLRR